MRRSWFRLALTWLAVWLIGYRLLQPAWPYAERWLLLSGVVLGYALWLLWRYLPENRRRHEAQLLPRLGPGNRLTMLRGLFIGLLAGFLFAPWPMGGLAWVVVLLYTAADVADYFDGYLARRANHSTVLGGKLDMEFDGLGLVIVSLLAVGYGQLPWWYLGVGAARYLFVFGLWWRRRNGRPIHDIPPSVHRRILAGLQMGLMSVVLWPIVPAAMATLGGTLIAVPLLLGFARDWLIVSGRLHPANETYNRVRRVLYQLLARRLSLLWRIGLALGMLAIIQAAAPWWRPQAWQALLQSWHVPGPGVLAMLLSAMAILGATAILLGVSGRVAAVLLLFPIGFDMATRGLTWENGAALTCAMLIVQFGVGPLTLWQPEERIFVRRAGAEVAGDGGVAA